RRADRLEVLEAAARLLGGRGADDLAGLRIERDLPRAEEELARAHGLAVGTDRLRRIGAPHDHAIGAHRGERTAPGPSALLPMRAQPRRGAGAGAGAGAGWALVSAPRSRAGARS